MQAADGATYRRMPVRLIRTTAATVLRMTVLSAPLVLAACQPAVLNSQGPVGAAEKTILIDSLAIMLAIVVPTILAVLAVAWRYRAGNTKAHYLPDWAYSGQVEMIVWAIPLLTIMLLGGVAWVGSHDLDPARPLDSKETAINVEVVSLDWKWLFIYPDQHVASVNHLVIPAGVPVHFRLTSASVMNAFFIPSLGSMIYTMNGMTTELNLSADHPGAFHGLSSHYSGDGFSDMHFNVDSMPADGFKAWLASTAANGPALTDATYTDLARQGVMAPATYAHVDDGLFEKIVGQALPPGPGPVAAVDAASPSTGK